MSARDKLIEEVASDAAVPIGSALSGVAVSSAVVHTDEDNVPALPSDFAEGFAAEHAGEGVSTLVEDSFISMVYILQDKSPQVEEGRPEYIEGACPGDIWLRNSGWPPVPGGQGLIVQPCARSRNWVEWKPARQGFVTRHEDRPPDTVEGVDIQTQRKFLYRQSNGNIIVDTVYFYILYQGRPFVIALSSTGHMFARQWNEYMKSFRLGDGRIYPSYMRKYRLTTRITTKTGSQFQWFAWHFDDLGWVDSKERVLQGHGLHNEVSQGSKVVEAEVVTDEGVPF